MPLIIGAKSAAAATGVANSCRFNSADSAKMAITFGGAGTSLRIATFSFWIKRSNLTVDEELLYRVSDGGDYFNIAFSSTDTWKIKQSISSVNLEFVSNAVYRDTSAWMHLLVVFDTTQATEADRVKIYVNGTQVTSWSTSTYPSQDTDMLFGAANENIIASAGGGNYFGGYLAEVCYCDGQALTTTDFGEFDEDSPTIWKPKDVSGLTFGDNGFYLDFEDSADLGADASGNSNDLTATNLDATDQATDTPTNNFATFNPLDNYYMGGTFSQGNTYWVTGSSEFAGQPATVGLAAGKWYWEVKVVADTSGDSEIIGIMSEQPTANSDQLGSKATDYGYYANDGDVDNNGSGTTYGDTYTVGDIIGVALDLTNNKIYWSKNGTWQDSGDPTSGATGTGAVSITAPASTPLGFYFPAFGYVNSSATATFGVNFGGSSGFTISSGNADGNGYGNFEYAPPSGYLALCTKNLGSDGG
jgi:hypothetical protein